MNKQDAAIFQVILSNQSAILHGIAIICDSGTVGCHKAADELRGMVKLTDEARKWIS